jgi:hypothetical protein
MEPELSLYPLERKLRLLVISHSLEDGKIIGAGKLKRVHSRRILANTQIVLKRHMENDPVLRE